MEFLFSYFKLESCGSSCLGSLVLIEGTQRRQFLIEEVSFWESVIPNRKALVVVVISRSLVA